ncbi:carboxymuconolactone decarboxylase family protein [Methylogaea oryzae]|uniref:Alkylhydroperoxidase n=2 Tax=Methylogaea oryzae TaxID=1295382 RepID=A0A8D4VQY4_9GAMM|nr:carboxymuconolactone decarboxylase family protein [Methylogaea oryzae]BBL70780.1 alkylhydroperoxidase [Methylogaea oryzae]
MNNDTVPRNYVLQKKEHQGFMAAVEALGKTVREQGPIDEKTAHLIQMAAAVAIHSEGSVHSHVRRALAAGASADEINHAIILLTSTIGFPTVSAALSWANDILAEE